MRKHIIQFLSAIACVCILTACGQKGPLYMPPEPDTTDPAAAMESTPDNESQTPEVTLNPGRAK